MRCNIVDLYVQVGDFLVVLKPIGPDVVGKFIDVSNLNGICIDEINIDDANSVFSSCLGFWYSFVHKW